MASLDFRQCEAHRIGIADTKDAVAIPIQLGDVLPAGWQDRIQPAFSGRVLQLSTLGRTDLLKAKLFALCDRGTDLADCLALAPTPNELAETLPWLSSQDANPDWPKHVTETIAELRRRIDGGV